MADDVDSNANEQEVKKKYTTRDGIYAFVKKYPGVHMDELINGAFATGYITDTWYLMSYANRSKLGWKIFGMINGGTLRQDISGRIYVSDASKEEAGKPNIGEVLTPTEFPG